MSLDLDQTIAAISSAPGIAARSIVRLSGRDAVAIALSITSPDQGVNPTRAEVTRRTIPLAGGRSISADYWIWPTERSYTRQPQVEIHLPGSRPIADGLLAKLRLHGARLAQPGEFTMRAFLAGRLDLTQAEAVLGMIDATGEGRFQSALRQLAGGLSGPLQSARSELVELLALLEAGLDFAEEDIEFITPEELSGRIARIRNCLGELHDQIKSRTYGQALPKVALVGLPNAGKSTLFNALTQSDDAITSSQAGTTRDFISRKVTWQGVDIELIDTAGHEVTFEHDELGKLMTEQTRFATEESDLCVLCIERSSGWNDAVCALRQHLPSDRLLVVFTKIDLNEGPAPTPGSLATSAKTGEGLELLENSILQRIEELQLSTTQMVPETAVRCLGAITLTVGALTTCEDGISQGISEELVASEIRFAIAQLAEVVGAVYADDLLDVIFSRFCIGK
ncbi:tRNA modification GTPase [Blastopirellula marina]|uniref:tRNA modification GTPase MnmE n=1 Tax=Blastopirellula marina TaxID=124 RepID=A0A2S8GDV3_9BACT|nr:GTPase [Blastopirellula marina]PQO42637.1 tRNA uridine-5-carboxymethylaminomethyl(34) synthesis GTPase MnmE [Blastopirellula marina]PTL46403.1 GTP-binding protein [Blastopirellula marina]